MPCQFNKVTRAWRNLARTVAVYLLTPSILGHSPCTVSGCSTKCVNIHNVHVLCLQPWSSYNILVRWVSYSAGFAIITTFHIATCSKQTLAANKISMHLLTVVTESHSLFGKNMHAMSTMNVAVWICRTMNTDCTWISHITDYREVPSSPTKVIPKWR